MEKIKAPEHVLSAVSSLLLPYGLKCSIIPISSNAQEEQDSKRRYLNVRSAVEYTSVSRWTLSRATLAGELKFIKTGSGKTNKVLYDILELQKFMERHTIHKRRDNMGKLKSGIIKMEVKDGNEI